MQRGKGLKPLKYNKNIKINFCLWVCLSDKGIGASFASCAMVVVKMCNVL